MGEATDQAFQAALKRTLNWEGGYSNDAADRGGETYCGISRRNWPEWEGWGAVDRATTVAVNVAARNVALAADPTLRTAVERFYHVRFWQPLQADQWPNTALAADVFDAAVNCGLETAVKLLQEALGLPVGVRDGVVGPQTLQAIGNASTGLLARFAAARVVRYAEIVAHTPSQATWLVGWVCRALAAFR